MNLRDRLYEVDYREIGSWKLEVGNWKLEVGDGKLEMGNWKLEVGDGKLGVGSEKLAIGDWMWKWKMGTGGYQNKNQVFFDFQSVFA